METFEAILTLLAAISSGALITGVAYLRRLSRDAKQALRFLRGEEGVEEDTGLIHEVKDIKNRLKRVENTVFNS